MDSFDHEKMEVYNLTIDFIALADEVVNGLPRGRAYLADQLRRACSSIALNIAEGAGEFAGDEKARFYRMAKRSATECAAVLDVCRRLDLANGKQLDAGRNLLLRIVSMLIQLIRRMAGSSGTGAGTGTE
ncbi:MAG: four helix bundle protein [Lentisphaeria bacterium]